MRSSPNAPNVVNVLTDPSTETRYEVVAYRELSRNELIRAVRVGVSRMKGKPKKKAIYRFITIIGHDDRI